MARPGPETSAGIAAEAGAYTRAQAIDEAVIAELAGRSTASAPRWTT